MADQLRDLSLESQRPGVEEKSRPQEGQGEHVDDQVRPALDADGMGDTDGDHRVVDRYRPGGPDDGAEDAVAAESGPLKQRPG
jgi:hypothetical protein